MIIAPHKYRLDHLAFGLLLMVVLFIPVFLIAQDVRQTVWISWFGQSLYWLGREIRDTEVRLRARLPDEWTLAWMPDSWSTDARKDFVIPVAGLFLLLLIGEMLTQ